MSNKITKVVFVCGFFMLIWASSIITLGKHRIYAQAGGEIRDAIITVNGQPVTRDDLYLTFVQLYPREAEAALNRLVDEILIEQEALKRGVTVTDEEINQRAKELGITIDLPPRVKRVIAVSILTEKMLVDEKKIKISGKEIRDFFEQRKMELGHPEQVRIRQIFVLSEGEAEDILVALNAGADFSKMAEAKSQDIATRAQGGDMGFFSRGMLLPAIENTVFAMNPGEISSTIQTETGFHIIKLEEKREPKEAKWDDGLRKRIRRMILNEKIEEVLSDWMTKLRANALME